MGLVFKLPNTLSIYAKFIGILLVLIFVGSSIFSYITAELNTNLYLASIDNVAELCSTESNPDFKYLKIISYEKALRKAKVYCIYKDSDKNLELELNYGRSKWQAYLTTKLNKERNFYWPIYL
jgi:hypothetical protein